MYIEKLLIKENYKYLWLKKIIGYDLSKHCAGCLLGEYNKQIEPSKKSYSNIMLDDGVYYLCGVKKYDTNMHIAFVNNEDQDIVIENDLFEVVIRDAKRLEFGAGDIDYSLQPSRLKSFNTCRNWQFANYLRKMGDDFESVNI